MQLRIRTNIKHNYVNVILKRLEAEQIVKCLTPNEVIGKVFCINPESRNRVNGIFGESGILQKVPPIPHLNWKAYGRVLSCRQMRKVFSEASKLKRAGRSITISVLKDRLLGMATSDIYRALDRLIELEAIRVLSVKPKTFSPTESGLAIIRFDPDVLHESGGSL